MTTGTNFSELTDAFTDDELADLLAAATERGCSPWELLHDAVMNDLAR